MEKHFGQPAIRRTMSDRICVYGSCKKAPEPRYRTILCEEHARVIWAAVNLHHDLEVQPKPKVKARPLFRLRSGTIYVIQLGDRVKIEFTTDLKRRLSDLPHEKVLATFPGTMADEQRFHRDFADLRVTGEWFQADARLFEFADQHKATR